MISRPSIVTALVAAAVLVLATWTDVPAAAQQPGYGPQVTYVPVAGRGGMDPYAIYPAGYQASPMGVFPGGITGGVLLPTARSMSNRLWARAEYLYWVTDGMRTPPLVTTSNTGTPQNQAAILGQPATATLFGGDEINDGATSGLRIKVGVLLNRQGGFGIEGEYFGFQAQNDGFSRAANGPAILGRPFFDTGEDRNRAQLIGFPGLVEGDVAIASDSDLRSFLINGRVSLCPTCGQNCGGCRQLDRTDWIVGYRRLELSDNLTFRENLNSLVTATPGSIALSESFRTSNEFNGLQLGVVQQTHFRRAWLESMLRVAVGNTTQTVSIAGSSALTEFGVTETFPGGLLAQRTNIGRYERDQFTLVPEIGLTLGIRLTDWLDATVGYTVLYYPNVVRAGDQIDTDVNPNLIPEEADPFSGALRPGFRFITDDYLAHGVSVGGEIRF